jgi:tetratricopeptide (TPR) repeat protein
VPIDRATVLKNAEKLLKQGKLEPAIAEFVRIVEEEPRDFSTANALGDLYVRAKRVDKAVEQFIRIADTLNEDGFLPKAAALYKKIIKLKPDHEHALLQAAEIAASQGRTRRRPRATSAATPRCGFGSATSIRPITRRA